MTKHPTCQLCGGRLKIRVGDPPYRGSCPNCKNSSDRLQIMTEVTNRARHATTVGLVVLKFSVLVFLVLVVWIAVGWEVGNRASAAGGKMTSPSLSDILLLKRKVSIEGQGVVTYHPFGKTR